MAPQREGGAADNRRPSGRQVVLLVQAPSDLHPASICGACNRRMLLYVSSSPPASRASWWTLYLAHRGSKTGGNARRTRESTLVAWPGPIRPPWSAPSTEALPPGSARHPASSWVPRSVPRGSRVRRTNRGNLSGLRLSSMGNICHGKMFSTVNGSPASMASSRTLFSVHRSSDVWQYSAGKKVYFGDLPWPPQQTSSLENSPKNYCKTSYVTLEANFIVGGGGGGHGGAGHDLFGDGHNRANWTSACSIFLYMYSRV
jgi:hypothetical protein